MSKHGEKANHKLSKLHLPRVYVHNLKIFSSQQEKLRKTANLHIEEAKTTTHFAPDY